MAKIQHPKGDYYMEDMLYENILPLKKRIEKDKDVVGIGVGSPGEGKSTIIQQIAYLLDRDLSCKDIVYDTEEGIKKSIIQFEKGKSKGKSKIYDEGKQISSTAIMTKKIRNFMNFLYENRQMNMFQYILTGDYFDLPKSIVMNRISFMIWVHEEREFDNGYFKFFNRTDARKLYIKGKKTRDMTAHKYTFRGTFPKRYTVDEEEYRDLKKSHLVIDRYITEDKDKELPIKSIVEWILNRNPSVRPKEIINCLKITPNYFFTLRKELEVTS